MNLELLFFAIPLGLMVFLPAFGCGLYFYEKRLAKKKVKPKKLRATPPPSKTFECHLGRDIVEQILADLENKPREWTIRWNNGNKKVVISATKTMAASQEGRENEISVMTDGTLSYQRCLNNSRATHDINLGKSDKSRLKKAFDALIEKKIQGALNQVVI